MSESFEVEYEDKNGLQLRVTVPMSEDQVMDLVRPLAAQMLLQAVFELRQSEFDAKESLRLGAYMVLTQAYGRDFVRNFLGLASRTEGRYAALVRDVVPADSAYVPGEELKELIARAAVAFDAKKKADG